MSQLYLLCGSSGCGKSTLMKSLAATRSFSVDPTLHEGFVNEEIDPETNAIRAPKYSERDVREKRDEIDDIIHVDRITKETHDICYVLNSVRYGLKSSEISELLDQGLNAFAVVSDLKAIRELKDIFPGRTKAVYVSSAIDADKLRRIQAERLGFSPDAEQKDMLRRHFMKTSAAARLGWWDRVSECLSELESDWHAYATDAYSTEIRIARIRATHTKYVQHIALFDHVVLNYSEGKPEEMSDQLRSIISSDEHRARARTPPIFVVSAASGAGKGTLMEAMNFMGGDSIRIVSKLAMREPRDMDRRDGMIALQRGLEDPVPEWPDWWEEDMIQTAEQGEFPPEYDLRWEFHKRRKGEAATSTWYAVSSREIWRNLRDGVPQILVSNLDEIDTFRELWPEHTVSIYLHRLVSDQENRKYQMDKWRDDPSQAEARVKERADVHRMFIRKAASIDHILLNTSYEEDLYDQLFHLITYYSS